MSETVKLDELFSAGTPGAPAPTTVKLDALFGQQDFNFKPGEKELQFAKDVGGNLAKTAGGVATNLAALTDMIVSLPGQMLGIGGDMGMRVRAAAAGIDRRTAAQMAQRFSHQISDPLSNPLKKLMSVFGYGEKYDASNVATVMNKAGSLISAGGEWVEKQTNGALLKEDVESLVNALMGAVGSKGTAMVVDPKLKALGTSKPGPATPGGPAPTQGPESYGPAVEDAKVVREPPGAPAPAAAPAVDPYLNWLERKQRETSVAEQDRFRNAEQRAYDLMQRGANKAEVDRAVAKDAMLGEALAAVRARRGQAAGASSGAYVRGQEGEFVGGRPEFVGPSRPDVTVSALMDVPQIAMGGDPRLPAPPRRIPYGPLAVGAVGGTVALNELFNGGDGKDAAVAGLAAMTFADLAKTGEATPLSALRERSPYTLKTIDRLPQNRFEFTREQVMQQLNRPDVSKAEKYILLGVLGDREKITAKELMMGFRERTGDFELKPKEVGDYADYGLEAIDRKTAVHQDEARMEYPMDMLRSWLGDANAPPSRTTVYNLPEGISTKHLEAAISKLPGGHTYFPNSWGHTRSFDEGGVRHVVEIQNNQAQYAERALRALGDVKENPRMTALATGAEKFHDTINSVKSTTTDIADAFDQYIALYEPLVQEDVKLRIGKDMYVSLLELHEAGKSTAPKPEVFQALRSFASDGRYEEIYDLVRNGYRESPTSIKDPEQLRGFGIAAEEAAYRETRRLAARENGHLAAQEYKKLEPITKDWYKRVVREELDAAAQARENPEWMKAKIELERAEWQLQNDIERVGNLYPDMVEATRDTVAKRKAALEKIPQMLTPGDKIRFATADTVAKVEGWPDARAARESQLADAQKRLTSAEDTVAALEAIKRGETPKDAYYSALKIADPEGFASVAKHVDAEIAYAQETLRETKLQFDRTKSNWGDQPRFRPEHQSIYDRYQKDIEKFLTKDLGGKPYTDSAGHTWIEVPLPKDPVTKRPGGPKQMLGFADPKMLAGIAALGLTGLIAANWEDVPGTLRTAGMAAVAGLGMIAAGRGGTLAEWARAAGHTAEKTIGNISAEVRTMSPELLRSWTRFEWQSLVRQHKATQAAAGFVNAFNALADDQRGILARAVMSGKDKNVHAALAAIGRPELGAEWAKVRAQLNELGAELKAAGLLKGLKADYFPRVVTDIDGLIDALGREGGDLLERRLAEANRASIKKTGDPLGALEASLIVNKYLEEAIRRPGGLGKAGFLKKRTIEEVTDELMPFYASPGEALSLYMRSASRQIERAKFFGKNLVRDAETGQMNIDDSIGRVVNDLGNRLNREQRARLEDLLRTRFGPGERSADRVTQAYRNITQGVLLGNPFSALGQLADVGVTAAMHGVFPTIRALWQTVQEARASATGKGRGEAGRFNMDDMGLADRIADEFVTTVKNPWMVKGVEISTANFAEKTLKWSGFNFTDEFGKLVNMNAAANALRAKAKSPGGRAELAARYGEYFGTDFTKLVDDLAAGRKSPLVGEAIFRELSDAQPLTKLEMPQAYVGTPSGRFLYTMKSWMIKQMSLVRERGLREMASSDPARARRGAEFLLRYVVLAGSAGATVTMLQNWLMGRAVEMVWGDVPENVLKTFGLGQYVRNKIAQGKPIEALVGVATPPYRIFDQILDQDPEAIAAIPVVGKVIYEHFGGGKEKAAERDAKAKRAAERANDPMAKLEAAERKREKELDRGTR